MQNLFNDGGFSNMGMSWKAMKVYLKSLEEILKEEQDITD